MALIKMATARPWARLISVQIGVWVGNHRMRGAIPAAEMLADGSTVKSPKLLVYQGYLSALDVGNINNYLGAKYDVSVPAPLPPALNYVQTGPVLTFTWQGAFKLQACTNLASGIWADFPGGTASGATTTNNSATPAMFFRLSQ